MKRHVSSISRTILLLICITGCRKDFLNSSQRNTLLREEYVQDLQSCAEYLNGLYMDLSLGHSVTNVLYPDLVADNIKPVTGSGANAAQYGWSQIADESAGNGPNMNGLSYSCYNIIVSCNFLLEKIDAFRQQEPARADDLKGQVLAMKALNYYYLATVFAQSYNFTADASHPGIVSTDATSWSNTFSRRNTVREIYDRITGDLATAVALLPAQATSTAVITKNAAKALLARIYLFRQDYARASVLAAHVAGAVPLMTKAKGYPNDLFKPLPPQNTEALFQLLPGTSPTLGHAGGGVFPGRYFRTAKAYVATSDIALLLQAHPNDLRKAWVTLTGGSWNITKFPAGLVPDVPADDAYLLPVLRTSEMFLTAAEAYAQLGRPDSARFYVNAIRKRAGIDTIAASVAPSQLMDSICLERRREMAFESLRMPDLLRWKKPVNRKDADNPALGFLAYPSNKAVSPIPDRDVKLSGLAQNPGY